MSFVGQQLNVQVKPMTFSSEQLRTLTECVFNKTTRKKNETGFFANKVSVCVSFERSLLHVQSVTANSW